MENEILSKIEAQNAKIDAIYVSVEKTRKYFQIIMYVTLATVLLPLIGLLFALPMFVSSYTSSFQGLL